MKYPSQSTVEAVPQVNPLSVELILKSNYLLNRLIYHTSALRKSSIRCALLAAGLISLCCLSLNIVITSIMYGLTQEQIDRVEKRIREKIEREKKEGQEKKRSNPQEEPTRERRAKRVRTESSPNEFISDKPHRVQSRNQGQELQQQSFFLPILNSNRKNTVREDPDSRTQIYPKHLSRPQDIKLSNSQYLPNSHNKNAASTQSPKKQGLSDEDDDKTLQYLQQCEQIINNIKQIASKQNRNSRKDSKLGTEQAFRGQPQKSDRNDKETMKPSFNISKHSFRIGASMPLQREQRGEKEKNKREGSPNESNLSRVVTPVISSWSSSNKKKKEESKMQDYINEFDQFNQPDDKEDQPSKIAVMEKKEIPKMKENNRKISSTKEGESKLQKDREAKQEKVKNKVNNYSISPPPNQEDENQYQQSQEEKEKPKKAIPAKTKAKETSTTPKQTPIKNKEKEKKAGTAPKQAKQDDSPNDKDKQQAVVDYLKKARQRGNLLSQKIEERKKQQPDQEEGK